MRNKALQAVEQYQMLPQGSRVTVALSGGADSVALLHFLCSLQKERMLGLQACHINHLLRAEESERDEAFVRKLCEDWRVPLKVYREMWLPGQKMQANQWNCLAGGYATSGFFRRLTAAW